MGCVAPQCCAPTWTNVVLRPGRRPFTASERACLRSPSCEGVLRPAAARAAAAGGRPGRDAGEFLLLAVGAPDATVVLTHAHGVWHSEHLGRLPIGRSIVIACRPTFAVVWPQSTVRLTSVRSPLMAEPTRSMDTVLSAPVSSFVRTPPRSPKTTGLADSILIGPRVALASCCRVADVCPLRFAVRSRRRRPFANCTSARRRSVAREPRRQRDGPVR